MNKLVLTILFSLYLSVSFQQDLETYKLFSYDLNGSLIGSRVGGMNMLTIHHQSKENMNRKLVLIKFEEIEKENLLQVMHRKPGGVLIILPSLEQNSREQSGKWEIIMSLFGNKNMIIPIQFIIANQEINTHYQYLAQQNNNQQQQDKEQQQYRLVVNADQSKLQFGRYDMQDYIASLEDNNRKKTTILLLASLDKFYPSQEFVNNQDMSNQIFFALMSRLQQLYNLSKNTNQNVLFYLTSSASLDFQGLQQFFDDQEHGMISSSIDSIIYLDNLGSSSNIFIEQYGSTVQYAETLRDTLKQNGFQVSLSQFDKDLSPVALNKRRIDVIRISDFQETDKIYIPIKQSADTQNSDQIVISLSTFLANHIFNSPEDQILEICSQSQQEYLQILNKQIQNQYRFISYIQSSELSQAAAKLFKKFRPQFIKQNYYLQGIKLYTSAIGKAQLIKYQDPFLNLYIFLGNITYLAILYFIFGKTSLIVKKVKQE